jgi:hypothetical protein
MLNVGGPIVLAVYVDLARQLPVLTALARCQTSRYAGTLDLAYGSRLVDYIPWHKYLATTL